MGKNKSSNTTSLNINLRKAKSQKKDEFYTQLTDIEKELKIIKSFLKARLFTVIVMTQELVIFFTIFHIILKYWV
jgi:hypothetical protein